jgi:GcrA cell cycle regulator
MNWTDEKIAMLKRLHKDGESCSQIAVMLRDGCTRSAVIGKLNRLGLSGRTPSKPSSHYTRRGRLKTSLLKAPKLAPVLLATVARPSLAIAFDDLQPHHCRWPTSRDRPHTFCGHPKQLGKPYCPAHCQRAYAPAYAPLAKPPQEHRKDFEQFERKAA